MSVPVLQERSPLDADAMTATGSGRPASASLMPRPAASSSRRGAVWAPARHIVARLTIWRIDAPQAGIFALGTASHAYHDLDLTGFIDGTENPTLAEAPDAVLVPDGMPGAGGTVLLLQKWAHDSTAWESLPVESQEQVIGRTKLDSVELDEGPEDSHVAR